MHMFLLGLGMLLVVVLVVCAWHAFWRQMGIHSNKDLRRLLLGRE